MDRSVTSVELLHDADDFFIPFVRGFGVCLAASLRYQEHGIFLLHLLGHRQLFDVPDKFFKVLLCFAVEADGAAWVYLEEGHLPRLIAVKRLAKKQFQLIHMESQNYYDQAHISGAMC